MKTDWYLAAESKKGRTIHLPVHFRLGASFSKCGKTLGRKITGISVAAYNPCVACALEKNKELDRERKRAQMEQTTPSWVPQEHSEKERAAKVALIKKLAEDLGTPGLGNFGATLESIVIHASALLKDESVRTGRGQKGA